MNRSPEPENLHSDINRSEQLGENENLQEAKRTQGYRGVDTLQKEKKAPGAREVGRVLRRARRGCCRTLEQLSAKTGLSVAMLSRFENGVCSISLAQFQVLAAAVYLSDEQIIGLVKGWRS